MNLSCLAFLDALSMVRSNKVSPSFTYYHPNTWRTMDRIVGHLVGSYPSSFVGPFGRPLRIVKLFNRWRRMSALGWWSQRVDATFYPEWGRSVWPCVEGTFEASQRQRKQSFGIAWQGGEALKAIGRAFGKPSFFIYFPLAPDG